MTTVFLIVFGAIAIFLVLLALVSAEQKADTSKRTKHGTQGNARQSVPRQDLVRRIFSSEDFDFISQTGSRHLRRFFELERRKVALHWVRRISQDAMQIMRVHRFASRRAEQLQPSLEAKLILCYLELRFMCAGLGLLIWIFGPHSLGMVAAHVGQMSRLIDQILANASTSMRVVSLENRGGY